MSSRTHRIRKAGCDIPPNQPKEIYSHEIEKFNGIDKRFLIRYLAAVDSKPPIESAGSEKAIK